MLDAGPGYPRCVWVFTGRSWTSPRRQRRSIAIIHSTTEATWMAHVGSERALAGSLLKWSAAEAASCQGARGSRVLVPHGTRGHTNEEARMHG